MKLPTLDGKKRVTVYFKGWDGHPWYIASGGRGNAHLHPDHRKGSVVFIDTDRLKKPDPFFSLDTRAIPRP